MNEKIDIIKNKLNDNKKERELLFEDLKKEIIIYYAFKNLIIGTKVKIMGKIYTVADRMNSRYNCNYFDIWMPTKQQAIEFGNKYVPVYKIIK